MQLGQDDNIWLHGEEYCIINVQGKGGRGATIDKSQKKMLLERDPNL